jgi:hypothetical protein
MKKPKIAVISSYEYIKQNVNYGAILQYFALQKFFLNQNIPCEWIRYEPKGKWNIKEAIKKVIFFNRYYQKRASIKKIMAFCKSNLICTKFSFNEATISASKIGADIYITGSDQVFGNPVPANFLAFVPQNKVLVAYAASFGSDKISFDNAQKITPWLKRFDFVSVREDSGVSICNSLGIVARKLCDPSFLISPQEYPSDLRDIHFHSYSFCYFLNQNKSYLRTFNQIEAEVKKRKETVFFPLGTGIRNYYPNCFKGLELSPEQWIGMLKNASYVFTNSFHGTVFALIFEKPFTCFLQNGLSSSQNDRMISLLKHFNLTDRIYVPNTNAINENAIDWARISLIKKHDREEAGLFFEEVLKKSEDKKL